MAKHLPNREIKLTPETDFFGHIDKGDAIVSFFKSNIDDLIHTNMFALYGKWGSGKSTMMKYIGEKLEEDSKYNCLQFPAWEFEKDDNLPLSLLHFISDETGTTDETLVKELLKDGYEVIKAIGKSVTLDFAGIRISGKEIIASGEKADEEREKELASLYYKTKKFKHKFKSAEDVIITKTKAKKLIVFIDDLDRCDPENVLSLLSSIKLFFTLSSNIIFFFGCDKEAISKAVQHKYGEIIKADEYLEKVIDISFNMPDEISLDKMLKHYFPEDMNYDGSPEFNSALLEEFFKSINFTNPRHLKKILNKFEIIRNFKKQSTLSHSHISLIPNVIIDHEGDLIETIFTFFFLILYEFYNKEFWELENYSRKTSNYAVLYSNTRKQSDGKSYNIGELRTLLDTSRNGILMNNIIPFSIKKIMAETKSLPTKYNSSLRQEYGFNIFLAVFTPLRTETFDFPISSTDFVNQFINGKNSPGELVCINFCHFLIERKKWLDNSKSEYPIDNFYKMCRTLL